MITLDFETEAIVGNPLVHPPKPVGLAYQVDDQEPHYIVGMQGMYDFLSQVYDSTEPLLFHNAPFDTRVAEAHLELPMPDWSRIHETMFLLYMADPYADTLSLKPSAERWLDEPPEEQNALRDWIIANVAGANERNHGAFIASAPRDLVEPYAKGDVHRTFGLFEKLRPTVPAEAYDRERRLMPILVRSSQRGIRVAREALSDAAERYTAALQAAEQHIVGTLGVPGLNPASGPQLGQALYEQGLLRQVVRTPTGRVSTKREHILQNIKDPELGNYIQYRAALETCVSTFMRAWLELSEEDGRLHTEWNQVKSTEGGKRGTRTGRLSASRPNFQNIPSNFNFEVPPNLPPMPNMREYLLPEEGSVWCKRDFSAQEIRIAAHFEEGQLFSAYNKDPNLDPHEMARQLIYEKTGKKFDRKHVKITGFQIIYGGGVNAIAGQVGCSRTEAQSLRSAYLNAMPGILQLQYGTKQRGMKNRPIRTWGGRKYYVEPPKDGRRFDYKLLNYLIQGSAADQTKQCIIDWDEQRGPDDVFLSTVHDEINMSAPRTDWQASMGKLRRAMEQDLFEVPMLSEGFVGDDWGHLEECE